MKRLLVIEDNETNMYLIGFILRKNKYKVIEARTGEEGVELALSQPDGRIQEKSVSFNGSKTHPLWYADAGRKAKKEILSVLSRRWPGLAKSIS